MFFLSIFIKSLYSLREFQTPLAIFKNFFSMVCYRIKISFNGFFSYLQETNQVSPSISNFLPCLGFFFALSWLLCQCFEYFLWYLTIIDKFCVSSITKLIFDLHIKSQLLIGGNCIHSLHT